MENSNSKKKFLIIKTSALGDIVHAYPVLEYIRANWPEAEIDWVVEKRAAALVSAHPLVGRSLIIDTKSWKKKPFSRSTKEQIITFLKAMRASEYDAVFDLQGNTKSGLIAAFSKSRCKIGFKKPREWPNRLFIRQGVTLPGGQNVRQDYLCLATSFFKKEAPQAILGHYRLKLQPDEKAQLEKIDALIEEKKAAREAIVVMPSAFWPNKELGLDVLINLLHQFQAQKNPLFIFVAHGVRERQRAEELYTHFKQHSLFLENLSLPLLQHLFDLVDLVIAMDSLPLHLAATTAVATLSFFGPTQSAIYGPVGERHRVFQGKCPFGVHFESRCPKLRSCPSGACLKNPSFDDLKSTCLKAKL